MFFTIIAVVSLYNFQQKTNLMILECRIQILTLSRYTTNQDHKSNEFPYFCTKKKIYRHLPINIVI